MTVNAIITQLRTTDLAASIRFYTGALGMNLAFRYQDFYAGIECGGHMFHLKHVDQRDPSIDAVGHGGHFHLYFQVDDVQALASRLQAQGIEIDAPLHETPWNTRELVMHDDQGHVLYFGQPLDSD